MQIKRIPVREREKLYSFKDLALPTCRDDPAKTWLGVPLRVIPPEYGDLPWLRTRASPASYLWHSEYKRVRWRPGLAFLSDEHFWQRMNYEVVVSIPRIRKYLSSRKSRSQRANLERLLALTTEEQERTSKPAAEAASPTTTEAEPPFPVDPLPLPKSDAACIAHMAAANSLLAEVAAHAAASGPEFKSAAREFARASEVAATLLARATSLAAPGSSD